MLQLEYRPTPDAPGFLDPTLPPVEPWVRPVEPTYTPPSVLGQGWYPKQCKMVNNGIGCQLKVTGPMTVTIGA